MKIIKIGAYIFLVLITLTLVTLVTISQVIITMKAFSLE